MDSYRRDADGYLRNTRTGEIANQLPDTVHHDGHYGGYTTPVYWYEDRSGKMVATDNALDAQYRGQDPGARLTPALKGLP